MPAPGAPNILLVVLDTVAAGHLGLYGYGRPTSPTLDELARSGIRFDAAQVGLVVDPAVSRDDVHGTMAPRALGGLGQPARPDASRRSPSTSARAATPRRASWPITCIAPPTRGCDRGFATYRDYIFPGSRR